MINVETYALAKAYTDKHGGGGGGGTSFDRKVITSTLTAGQTSLSFSDDAITETSAISIFSDKDVNLVSREVSGVTLTLTFEAIAENASIKIIVEE